jgi:hypothetical protein
MNSSKAAYYSASSYCVSAIPYTKEALTSANLALSLLSMSEFVKSANLIRALIIVPYFVCARAF